MNEIDRLQNLSVSFVLNFESFTGRAECLRIRRKPEEGHGMRRYTAHCRPTMRLNIIIIL